MGALVSRRRLILGGLVAGATLAFGRGVTLYAPAPGARVLSARELEIVRGASEALFPAGVLPVDGPGARVADEVDRLLAEWMVEPHRSAFRYVLRSLEWGTLASRGTRFSQLSVEERREVIDAWNEPRLIARRAAMDSVRMVLGMAYFRHPAVLAAIGWRAGCATGSA
jgi:hypothetical protein